MIDNEKTYHGKRDINYLFLEGAKNSPYLIVIFQAAPLAKNNYEKAYGYKKTLNKVNFHKLYIEDTYGLLGCYYMCENMDFSIEESTVMLIADIMKQYGISKKNVITCGSAKGGTGALYFASKYGLGHAVCGVPHTRVGSFICELNEETAKFMMGDTLPEENIEYLNRVVLRYINKDCTSDIRIFSSTNDKQFNTHMAPLIARAKECDVPLDITLDDTVKTSHDILKSFRTFLVDNIFDIVLKDLNRKKPIISFKRNGLSIEGAGLRNDGVRFRVRIVDDSDTNILYQEDIGKDRYEYTPREIMSGYIYLDLSVNGEEWLSYRASDFIFDQWCFKYNGYDVEFNKKQKTLKIKINVDEPHSKLRYVYSLSRNKEKIVPSFVFDKNEYTFDIEQSGEYRITFSLKMKYVGKLLRRTNIIKVKID